MNEYKITTEDRQANDWKRFLDKIYYKTKNKSYFCSITYFVSLYQAALS